MKLEKFIDPLPLPPVMKPAFKSKEYTYYEVRMRENKHRFHRDLPETTIWGYEGLYPGPTIEVEQGELVYVQWMNELPDKHFLPLDYTVHGAGEEVPDVRTVVHLHGGRTEEDSDGYPDAWFTRNFQTTGPFFKKRVYEYRNLQSARNLWYHDHAIGITRLNIYAGLVGFYLIRNSRERSLALPKGDFDLPLLIQDKSFKQDGSLFYPDQPKNRLQKVVPSIVSEFFGDTILVNGKVWPYLEVEPRRYRFRFLNGSNSRYFRLKLSPAQWFYLIGTDSGFIEKPVGLKTITLAPAERMDVIIDFSQMQGKEVILKNNAPTAFPNGDPVDAETTGTVMQFRVSKPLSSQDTSIIPETFRSIHWLSEAAASVSRFLELGESKDQYGRTIMLLDRKKWDTPISENPISGSIEIWNFVNVTPDDHPIHLHLVQFQILDRRAFDVKHYKKTGRLHFTGPPIPAHPQEHGWKDMVRTPPDHVTRIIVPFFPYTGQYVWHCHMLEHEDYEMMRPYRVLPANFGYPNWIGKP